MQRLADRRREWCWIFVLRKQDEIPNESLLWIILAVCLTLLLFDIPYCQELHPCMLCKHSDFPHSSEQAERVGAVQLGWEKALGRPYSSLPVPEGACKRAGEGLFARACRDRTRSNGFKLKEGKFRLDLRKKCFIMRVGRHWNRLPREVVAAPP